MINLFLNNILNVTCLCVNPIFSFWITSPRTPPNYNFTIQWSISNYWCVWPSVRQPVYALFLMTSRLQNSRCLGLTCVYQDLILESSQCMLKMSLNAYMVGNVVSGGEVDTVTTELSSHVFSNDDNLLRAILNPTRICSKLYVRHFPDKIFCEVGYKSRSEKNNSKSYII